MPPILPPDLVQADRELFPYAPSWSVSGAFLNDEHRGIFEVTKGLPGWQDPADSEKLYEMAYHNGSVILEIGVFGGRSAVVEMRGALAAASARGLPAPQFYGVDVDPNAIPRSQKTIDDARVSDRCSLFHGNLAQFLREIPIKPTMVFVDGDHRYPGCWADLQTLSQWLEPGTPVMCHDYGGIPDVRRAVDEWIATGSYECMGRFAGSILLRARGTHAGAGFGRGLSPAAFAELRDSLRARYFSPAPPTLRRDRLHTPVRDLTSVARRDLRGDGGRRVVSGRAAWPYAPTDEAPLPHTMPGGVPWPKISIVTPSYNQGRYIEETILSVRNQDYPNVEHIVMDGGSADETMAIVDRYRDGFATVVSAKDEGQSDAINKGFARATGEILTWLNSDDMLAPGALAAMALGFQRSGADMVAGECHVHRDGVFVSRHLTSCENGPLPLDELLDIYGHWLEGRFFYQPEVMFTRALWEKAGGHVRTDLYHSMDYELWCRMAAAGAKLHVIGRPIALFRAHAEQKTAGTVVGGFRVELPKTREAFLERTGLKHNPPARQAFRDKIRVVLFNDLGYAYGAGIAHRRMAEALALGGHEVFTVAAASTEIHGSAPRSTFQDALARIASFKPDLVVVGNLHGADLDPALLGLIAAQFQTAFVMHDLWLLTGRCAYTGGCRKYLEGCDQSCTCDKQHPKLEPSLVKPAWETKRGILQSEPSLHIWANSEWALTRVREALAMSRAPGSSEPAAISFGLELDTFQPRDKAMCREELGLPAGKFIVMTSSSSLADPRKGLQHLAAAMKELNLDDAMVVGVGWFGEGEEAPIPGMRAMGYMDDPKRLAKLYAAADVFVGPSLEEAFGQVFIEAAACGTPSIGYPVGGKPEAILDGVSGLLTENATPAALAAAIETLYMDPELRGNLARWGRIWVESRFSMSASAHRLYGVMGRQGLVERLRIGPRLNLALAVQQPPEPVVVAATLPAWRAVDGFSYWEGPYPDKRLQRCRWALGPIAKFEIESAVTGRARILISCRTYDPGQRVRLVHGGQSAGEREVPPDAGAHADRVLSFPVHLHPGANRFEMHFWKWNTSANRPLALLVTSITAVSDAPRPSAAANGHARQPAIVETKPAGAGVR